MYELVNTSTPQGLMPGSRGFATVAMTKGMPDAIRVRVEGFCAYPHRTSERGERYWTENPVNYFHLLMPSGGHVAGRIAPSDFDYTGRTNRLAHLLYFDPREMPANGGAFVLAEAKERLSRPWDGEPGYLEEDVQALNRWRLASPLSGGALRRWTDVFGQQGEEYARRLALQLEKNVGGSSAIYFRTSAATDASGEILLDLFGELIGLVSADAARKVAFATYAACVPSGIVCHLQGVYDEDDAFVRGSAFSPWVDCVNRRVVHPELLPELPAEKVRIVPVAKCPARTSAMPARTIRHQGEALRPTLTERRNDGFNWLLALIVGGSVMLAVIALATMYCITQTPEIPAYGSNAQSSDRSGRNEIDNDFEKYSSELEKLERDADAAKRNTNTVESIEKLCEVENTARGALKNVEGAANEGNRKVEELRPKFEELCRKCTSPTDGKIEKLENEKKELERKRKEEEQAAKPEKPKEQEIQLKDCMGGIKLWRSSSSADFGEKYEIPKPEDKILMWGMVDGKVENVSTNWVVTTKPKQKFRLPEIDWIDKSPWMVVRVNDKAYWISRRKPVKEEIFRDDSLRQGDLIDAFFGNRDAYKLCKNAVATNIKFRITLDDCEFIAEADKAYPDVVKQWKLMMEPERAKGNGRDEAKHAAESGESGESARKNKGKTGDPKPAGDKKGKGREERLNEKWDGMKKEKWSIVLGDARLKEGWRKVEK